MKLYSNRAGYLYHVSSGYDCFIPLPLSEIRLQNDLETINLLAQAERQLSKLNSICSLLPDGDLFLAMYVQKEAVVSSQIEGTQVSLSDVLQKEKNKKELVGDTKEVVNYVKALDYGFQLLDSLPICQRLLSQIHKVLLDGGRGSEKEPGQIRHSQNWIGGEGCDLNQASFVPPCPGKMEECFSDLEKFINDEYPVLPPLIRIALIHYQFETIHPYLDGNGRVGRMLFPLFLKQVGLLNKPYIYLSLYLKQNQSEYYGLLSDVRTKGRYEEWINFFIKGIIDSANSSIQLIQNISILKKGCEQKIRSLGLKNDKHILQALSFIFSHPYFSNEDLGLALKVSKPTSIKIANYFMKLDIIKKTDSKKVRYVAFEFYEYVALLNQGTVI